MAIDSKIKIDPAIPASLTSGDGSSKQLEKSSSTQKRKIEDLRIVEKNRKTQMRHEKSDFLKNTPDMRENSQSEKGNEKKLSHPEVPDYVKEMGFTMDDFIEPNQNDSSEPKIFDPTSLSEEDRRKLVGENKNIFEVPHPRGGAPLPEPLIKK